MNVVNSKRLFIPVFIFTALAAGCSTKEPIDHILVNTNTPADVVTLPTDIPTTTIELTSTPEELTATQIPTSSPMTLTAAASVFPYDFFFGVLDESQCDLPCFHDIYFGETSIEQSVDILIEIYGNPNVVKTSNIGWYGDSTVEVLTWLGADPPDYDAFSVWLLSEEGSYTDGMIMVWQGQSFPHQISPQRVIRELGQPDEVWIDTELAGQGPGIHANMELIIQYDQGLSFFYQEEIPVLEDTIETDKPIATLCLDEFNPWETFAFGSVSITEGLSSETKNLTDIQVRLHFEDVTYMTRLQETTTLSLADITNLALMQDNACIETAIIDF